MFDMNMNLSLFCYWNKLSLTKLYFRFYRIFVIRFTAADTQLVNISKSNSFDTNFTSADSNRFYVTYQQEQFNNETLTITVGDGTSNKGTVKQMLLYYCEQYSEANFVTHLRWSVLRK